MTEDTRSFVCVYVCIYVIIFHGIIITIAFCPADKIRVQSTVDQCDSAQVGPSGDSTSEKTDKTDRGVGSIASDEAHHRKTVGRSPDTSLQHGTCFFITLVKNTLRCLYWLHNL